MSELFLTGMFRSGSTTLARALNAHKNIAFASDPYLEILKTLRSQIAKEVSRDIPFMQPLGDYYFSDEDLNLLQKIENADPQNLFDKKIWDGLRPVLKKRCNVYSENLVPYLDSIKGNNYKEVLSSGLQKIKECYGDENTTITGFKEVWGVEFIPFFLKCFPKGKAIFLQRDPRAVCASKNKTEEKYPWIFLCRQWRKLASLGWSYAHDEKYKDRILLLNFEDFVNDAEKVTKDICRFLDIEWDPSIADASCYRGGGGEPWKQNTSFGKGTAKFDKKAAERWKNTLSEDEIGYIEYMCGPEMSLYGYNAGAQKHYDYWLKNSPRIDSADQALWMKELVPNDEDTLFQEMKKEEIRNKILTKDQVLEDVNLIKQSFIKEDVYQSLNQSDKKVFVN